MTGGIVERGNPPVPFPGSQPPQQVYTEPMRLSRPTVPAAPRARRVAACLAALSLGACTIPFTPGDAKPAVYSPYPAGAASGSGTPEGQGMRGGPGTPP